MRKILLDRQPVDDRWIYLGADDAVPVEGDILVPQARFLKETDALLGRTGGKLGVRVEAGEGIAALLPHLARITLVGMVFPAFHDGRGLSYARELRERHGYQGEIRAIADVIRDVVLGMHRCGINSFEIKEGQTAEGLLAALGEFSKAYQADVHEPRPIYRRA